MLRRMTAGVLLVASVACTSLTPSADCSSSACPDGQTCDATTQLCVLDLGPQITVLSPKPDAAVKDPALEVRGTVTTWSDSTLVGMSYQLLDAGTAIPLAEVDRQIVDGMRSSSTAFKDLGRRQLKTPDGWMTAIHLRFVPRGESRAVQLLHAYTQRGRAFLQVAATAPDGRFAELEPEFLKILSTLDTPMAAAPALAGSGAARPPGAAEASRSDLPPSRAAPPPRRRSPRRER